MLFVERLVERLEETWETQQLHEVLDLVVRRNVVK
jgi:hypothetical protein